MSTTFTMGKKERLKSRKLINELFEKGKKLPSKSFGMRYILREKVSEGYKLQVGVTASTRLFPGSVQRNRVKRMLREVWRRNKLGLRDKMKDQDQLLVFFIYTSKEIPEFSILEKEMQTLIGKLENLIVH